MKTTRNRGGAVEKLTGNHRAEFDQGDLSGTVSGNVVKFQKPVSDSGAGPLVCVQGTVNEDKISGVLNMGEYGETTWRAERHKYQGGGRRG